MENTIEPLDQSPPVRRTLPLVVLAVVVIIGVIAIFVAVNSNSEDLQPKADVNNLPVLKSKAPALDTSLGWTNTKGYTQAQLRDKVVIYDFWTYSCINCQRTMPYLRALWDRYKGDGLVIIGIHSPEFDFEKVHPNIVNATKRYNVTWPVLYDDNMSNWNNFQNQYWPAKYIADKQGRIRYQHFGEGSYDETENVVRKLLGTKSSAPHAKFPGSKESSTQEQITPELYINPVRGPITATVGKTTIKDHTTPDLDSLSLFGEVDVQLTRTVLSEPGSALSLHYVAGQVNIVAEPLSENGVLSVTLDDKPIPESMRGDDIKTNSEGNTILNVTASDLLHVIQDSAVGNHVLTFTSQSKDIALYSFTFGGANA